MSTSPSSSTLPSERTDILARCKDTIEMLNETLEEERSHSQLLADRLRQTEEEVQLLREETSTLKHRHKGDCDRILAQGQDREAKIGMLKDKLGALVAANADLLDRNKVLEENNKKKDGLASEWQNVINKMESDTQMLLEENAKLLAEREDIRLLVQQVFSNPGNQQPPWSSQASATSMTLAPVMRDGREQTYSTQVREERLTQSITVGPNTDESRTSAYANASIADKITAILRGAAVTMEENERLRAEVEGLHSLMEEHAGVMENAENDKQKLQADFTEQLNHMCHTIHELHKDIQNLTQEKRDLEDVAERMREQLEEESINNDRLQRRLRILREEKDDQQPKQTSRGIASHNSTSGSTAAHSDKTSTKLIEVLEKQLEERNSDLAEIRERVKELENVYRSELATILLQGTQPNRGTSLETPAVLGERRQNTENTSPHPQSHKLLRMQHTPTQKETSLKNSERDELEQKDLLLGRFRQVNSY